ncbi:MAG TPA: hypothetical protein VE987_12960 [Polyangiaceae bacterium]|nr:hypothetical protein [Polyangiaceae bacterium]
MNTRTAWGLQTTIDLKVRMQLADAWALCRIEALPSDDRANPLVLEESDTTGTGAVARAAGVLVERLRDRGYEPKLEEVLVAIERALAASLVGRARAAGARS